MPRSTHCLFTILLMLAPLPAMAAAPSVVDPGTGMQNLGTGVGKAKGGKLAGVFTPEQRAMWMRDGRGDMTNMTPDEKKAYRKQQTAKILAMSQTDRQNFKTGLQTEWDSLPQKQKTRLAQRLATRQSGQPGK